MNHIDVVECASRLVQSCEQCHTFCIFSVEHQDNRFRDKSIVKFGKGRRWRSFAANCGMLIIMEELDAALGPFPPVLNSIRASGDGGEKTR